MYPFRFGEPSKFSNFDVDHISCIVLPSSHQRSKILNIFILQNIIFGYRKKSILGFETKFQIELI